MAACVEAILVNEGDDLLQLYARDLGLELEATASWLAALAGLHDLGKAFPAFQLKWRRDRRERGKELLQAGGLVWHASEILGQAPGHGVVSQVLLETLLVDLGFKEKAAKQIADALGAHHGFRAADTERVAARARKGTGLWEEARRWLLEQVLVCTKAANYPPPPVEGLGGQAFMRLAGLVSFADWIGSNSRWFIFERETENLETFYADAKVRAREALEDIGWPRPEKKHITFEAVFGFAPRQLQSLTVELLGKQTTPALLLIEAPMGEGKTEAALYASRMLQNQVGHRGFYVALPTQATGSAMFERVGKDYLAKLGYSRPPDLQLIHGAALLDKRFAEMRLQVGEEAKPEQSVVAHEWFSHKKQGLLSPHAVGTLDQSLLGALNVGHHFVRLWGLGNRVVVLDEIHAYELYTSKLMERLLAWLLAMNSSVILLSATLPLETRRRLLTAWGAPLPADDAPYPRITLAAEGRAEVRSFETRRLRYTLRQAPLDTAELAEKLVELSQGGGAVGCIVNTVSRAQELYQLVKEKLAGQGNPPRLFHARFPAQKRRDIETWAVQHLGKGNKGKRDCILIATQVAEQSLDVDFDVLVTDLCPVDLLIQRAGRLHRHDDPKTFQRVHRGAHTEPILYISGLTADFAQLDLGRYYWDTVYDRATLLRSWAVLRERLTTDGKLHLPQDFQGEASLLERVYGEGRLEHPFGSAFENALAESDQKLEEAKRKEKRLASDTAIYEPERILNEPPGANRYP